MTPVDYMTLISVVSVKGGTGKTITSLNLSALLSEMVPTIVIEGQRENPQYASLLFANNPTTTNILNQGTFVNTILESPTFTPASSSEVFSVRPASNLYFIILHPPKGRFESEGNQVKLIKVGTLSGGELRQLTASQEHIMMYSECMQAISRNFTNERQAVIIDYDAGIATQANQILAFHRAVNGYGIEQLINEHIALNPVDAQRDVHKILESYVFERSFNFLSGRIGVDSGVPMILDTKAGMQPILLDDEFTPYGRFKSGFLVFVANPSKAEINALVDRKFFFRDLGASNHYILVINQAREEDVREIDTFLRKQMGADYMFEGVFGLPSISYMEFGNMRVGGNSFLLPVFSENQECMTYTEQIRKLASFISCKM